MHDPGGDDLLISGICSSIDSIVAETSEKPPDDYAVKPAIR